MSVSLRAMRALAAVTLPLLLACQSGAPAPQADGRVVVVSFDGLGADLAWSWIDSGGPSTDGLAGMAARGLGVRRLRPVDPTMTAVNHISLATGRPPAGTGIVGNAFLRPGTTVPELMSGFAAPIEAETLWQAARRQGLRTGVLVWPGADGADDARRGDFGMVWPPTPLAPSELLELLPGDAAACRELPSEDDVAGLEWRVQLPGGGGAAPTELLIAVVDSDADGRPRYDTIGVRRAADDDWRLYSEREWFDVATDPGSDGVRAGAWCKVLRLDRRAGVLRLYRGGVHRTIAYPEAFAARLDAEVGFWPGPPDERLLAAWWQDAAAGIDLEVFLEQLERMDRFMAAATRFAIEREPFRLLMAYHPTPDEYQHAALLVDPRQWAWSAGREFAAREGLRRVVDSVDAAVAEVWRALDPARDALVVVSDHGLAPVFEGVRLERLLADAGLLVPRRADSVFDLALDSPLLAVPSGASAHLYLNRFTGRRQVEDAIPPAELLARAARALADLHHEGTPVVERVWTRQEAAQAGLGHPACGDLVVLLHPGFVFLPGADGPVLEASRLYGQHGFHSSHDAMAAVLFARGAPVARGQRAEMPITGVAPMVAAWLGIELR